MEGNAHLLPEEGDRDIFQIRIGMAEKLVSVRIDAGDHVSVDRELCKTVFKVASAGSSTGLALSALNAGVPSTVKVLNCAGTSSAGSLYQE